MPKYTVIEVQEVTRLRKWTHEVEADTPEEAIEKVKSGDADLIPDGGQNIGEEDYGDSGFSVETPGVDAQAAAVADYRGVPQFSPQTRHNHYINGVQDRFLDRE